MQFTITAKNGAGAIVHGPLSAQEAMNKALDLAAQGFTDIVVGNPATGAKVDAQQFMRDQSNA